MIPQEAIAAAAEIILQGDMDICECRRSPFDKHDVNPPCSKRKWALDKAQRSLTAAAPFLRAQALEDAAEALELPGSDATGYYSGNEHYGYEQAERHAETWLRARAATERGDDARKD